MGCCKFHQNFSDIKKSLNLSSNSSMLLSLRYLLYQILGKNLFINLFYFPNLNLKVLGSYRLIIISSNFHEDINFKKRVFFERKLRYSSRQPIKLRIITLP